LSPANGNSDSKAAAFAAAEAMDAELALNDCRQWPAEPESAGTFSDRCEYIPVGFEKNIHVFYDPKKSPPIPAPPRPRGSS
jgi:hypothetical protein